MRVRYLVIAGIALACAEPPVAPLVPVPIEPLVPRNVLIGTWSSPEGTGWPIQLVAGDTSADLRTPCTTAHFPPLRLDDSLTFQAKGVFTAAVGLVTVHVGDSTSIAGRVVGLRVVVGAFTLERGGSGPVVCNA
jgi:hypothetical protein